MIPAMSEEVRPDVAAYMALAPDDAEWARRVVEPYADMTPWERLQALAVLNSWVDVMLDGRMPETENGDWPFWMYWKGLVHGSRR